MSVIITKAEENDVVEISNIYHQTTMLHLESIKREFKPSQLEDTMAYVSSIINKEDVVLFKAKFDNKIAGYLVLYINSYPDQFFVEAKRGFIGSIGVDENVRGQGIGNSLLLHAETYLKEQNISIFETDVYVFNTKAEKLYNDFGFEDIKRYKRKFLK